MKKLKKKVFLVIFMILTLVTTGILIVYNAQLYHQQYQAVVRSCSNPYGMFGFERFDKKDGELSPPDGNADFDRDDIGNIRFMDSTVYTVLLDSDNNITDIINHSDNDVTDAEIEAVAADIIKTGEQAHYGNLYFSKYAYSFESGRHICIVDNAAVNELLQKSLTVSLCVYLLLELIIFLIARRLTVWIAKPVAESFDKQKQFIADASHELKTPLAVIIASADALESNPNETKWLSNIKSESDRMNKLIADLLDLAKSEATDDTSSFTVGSLSKTVEMSTLTFEGVMFEKGIALEDEIQDGIALNMNPYKIKQLMSILLDNAVKHSKAGGAVQVALKEDKDIVLTVTNQGEGIPQGEEEKIFERFYRADEARNRNENRYGLGLAIAKNICQSHNADITAKSENGYTTFKVVFHE